MASWQSGNSDPAKTKGRMVEIATNRFGPITNAKILAKNTLGFTTELGSEVVQLHETPILIFKRTGAIEISTGGYNTKTTRGRLCEFGRGKVRAYTGKGRLFINGAECREAATVRKDGTVKPDVKPGANDRLVKLIDAFMAHAQKKGLPSREESGGDPWIFSLQQVGESVMMDWLKSKYFTRRLMALAYEFSGLAPMGVAYSIDDIDRRGKLDSRDLRRLRRFIRSRVGLES